MKHTPEQSKAETQSNGELTQSEEPETGLANSFAIFDRKKEDPQPLTAKTILSLQSTIGNQAVQRLIQKQKLKKNEVQRVGLTVEELTNVRSARNFWQQKTARPANPFSQVATHSEAYSGPVQTPYDNNPYSGPQPPVGDSPAANQPQAGNDNHTLEHYNNEASDGYLNLGSSAYSGNQAVSYESYENPAPASPYNNNNGVQNGLYNHNLNPYIYAGSSDEAASEAPAPVRYHNAAPALAPESNNPAATSNQPAQIPSFPSPVANNSQLGSQNYTFDENAAYNSPYGGASPYIVSSQLYTSESNGNQAPGENAPNNEPVSNQGVQRPAQPSSNLNLDTFLQQRSVDPLYKNERTKQSQIMVGGIINAAARLKLLYEAYMQAAANQAPDTEARKKAWQTHYKFMIKQDIDVKEDGTFDPASLNDRLVKYDETKVEQEATKVTVSNGLLMRSNGEPVDTTESVVFTHYTNGQEIFVMSPEGDLHMASHKIGKYHHSSLLAGTNVAAAGAMKAQGGKIELVTDKSGHYQPKREQMVQLLQRLAKEGVSLYFRLELIIINFKGLASVFLSENEPDFEIATTKHVKTNFVDAYGAARVKAAFDQANWKKQKRGWETKYIKPDGSAATQKEIRNMLMLHFGEAAKPNVTNG